MTATSLQVNDGWRDSAGSMFRRLKLSDRRWFGIVILNPDGWATRHGWVPVELFDRDHLRHRILPSGQEGLDPNKRWHIQSLDEDEIERQLREKLRVLNLPRLKAKVRP